MIPVLLENMRPLAPIQSKSSDFLELEATLALPHLWTDGFPARRPSSMPLCFPLPSTLFSSVPHWRSHARSEVSCPEAAAMSFALPHQPDTTTSQATTSPEQEIAKKKRAAQGLKKALRRL